MSNKTITIKRNGTKRGRYILYSDYANRVLFDIGSALGTLLVWSGGETLIDATTETVNATIYAEDVTPEGGGAAVKAAVGVFFNGAQVEAFQALKQPIFYRVRVEDGEDLFPLAEGRIVIEA